MRIDHVAPAGIYPIPSTQLLGSLPYLTLAAGLACTHPQRNDAGECVSHLGCLEGALPCACGCWDCARVDGTRPDQVNPYARDLRERFEPLGPGAYVRLCRKIACYNAGNGRECWTVHEGTHRPRLFELPDRATAERVAREGGFISRTHLHSFC